MLTIGSLFSGIGGLELGLERAGLGPVKWQVEIDPYCRAVLARHWPDAERFDDVRTVGRGNLAPVDVICGGFPCQDISTLGGQAGLDGARSGLWRDFSRVVGEVRPRYVVVENVAALAVNGLDRVLADLACYGLNAVWFPLAAGDVGAPHIRERLFVVAYAEGEGHARSWDGGKGCGACRPGLDAPEMAGPRAWGERVSDVCRVDDGLSPRLDRIRALGNAVVPQVAEVVGRVVRVIHRRLTCETP